MIQQVTEGTGRMATEKVNPGFAQDQVDDSGNIERRLRKADRMGEFVCSLPKWIVYAIIVWQASLSIVAMTGQNSLASFLVRFDRQTSWWELVCWGAALLGILYGIYTGHLLHRQTANQVSRLALIEKRLSELQGDHPSERALKIGPHGHSPV